MSETAAVRHARAYLLRAVEPPAERTAEFVGRVGPVVAARAIANRHAPRPILGELRGGDHWELAQDDLARAEQYGARLVTPEDNDEWPTVRLAALTQATGQGQQRLAPPLALWVRGHTSRRLHDLTQDAVAIVGARAADGYGAHITAELAYGLAERGVVVYSGAAYGIDGAAHRGALAAGGLTVAVLACGLDVGYPAGHLGLLDRIAEQGLVVSEYPWGMPPARHRFLVRNRLLAALPRGLVVAQAGRRSGAVNAARSAHVLGRTVMAVPGAATSALSFGGHELIREGIAQLVVDTPQVLPNCVASNALPASPGPAEVSTDTPIQDELRDLPRHGQW